MLFNSLPFGYFFVVTTTAFFLIGHRWRPWLLLIASCYFYASFIPKYLLILFALILIDYSAALAIERAKKRNRRRLLLVSLAANLGLLFVFKYFNFFVETTGSLAHLFGRGTPAPTLDLLLPIGLSFHTFQSLAYVIEVYYGRYRAERDLKTYALYVLFYPQMVAGPIERPQNLLPQLKKNHKFDYARVTEGLRRMLWGFFKKAVIADCAAQYVNRVFADPESFHGVPLLMATYLFTLQIYCDFSGYSDIAIGAAKVMGFDLMTNFKQPYFSSSLRQFWQRWHISLSTWFRDYLYIPLGGNKGGRFLQFRNLIIVFAVSGLWHGASWTFVLWGLWHGLFLIFEKAWSPHVPRRVGTFVTFQIVAFGWIFFRANSMQDAFTVFSNLFNFRTGFYGALDGFGVYTFACLSVATAVMFAVEHLEVDQRPKQFLYAKLRPVRWAVYYGLVFSILVFGVFNKTQFIYFQF